MGKLGYKYNIHGGSAWVVAYHPLWALHVVHDYLDHVFMEGCCHLRDFFPHKIGRGPLLYRLFTGYKIWRNNFNILVLEERPESETTYTKLVYSSRKSE